MTSKEIRKQFLDFFASKGHRIVPSAPMVVKGDPTLMFTNAGMNQFKDWFLGNTPILYPRVADSQKCLRVTMTWRRSATIPTTTLCSRCWATGASATTSRKRP